MGSHALSSQVWMLVGCQRIGEEKLPGLEGDLCLPLCLLGLAPSLFLSDASAC
jgi:hypothetical protein